MCVREWDCICQIRMKNTRETAKGKKKLFLDWHRIDCILFHILFFCTFIRSLRLAFIRCQFNIKLKTEKKGEKVSCFFPLSGEMPLSMRWLTHKQCNDQMLFCRCEQWPCSIFYSIRHFQFVFCVASIVDNRKKIQRSHCCANQNAQN